MHYDAAMAAIPTTAALADSPAPSSGRTGLFLCGAVAAALALGVVADFTQQIAAPWLLFPLAQGASLAAALVGNMRLAGVVRPRWLVAVAVGAALLSCGFQHQAAYLRATRSDATESDNHAARLAFPEHESRITPNGLSSFLDRQASAGRPLPGGIVARGAWAWASWALDAGLVIVGTLAGVRLIAGSGSVVETPDAK